MARTKRLGDRLIGRDLITADQLKQALDAQLIYGGQLGTCLIEQGHLSEKDLGDTLQEVFGVPYVAPDRFDEIPKYVIETMPRSIAEKHRVVPFALKEKVVQLAMVDPKDLGAHDEISFATGQRIQAWVCPEVRLYQALERFYNIARRTRYITLCRALDHRASGEKLVIEHAGGDLVFEEDVIDRTSTGSAQPEEPDVIVAPAARAPATVSRKTAGTAATAIPATPPAADRPDALAAVSRHLCAAETRHEIAEVVLDHIATTIPRSILFTVKGGRAEVWRTEGIELDASRAGIRLSVTSEPIFNLMLGSLQYFGPVPQDEGCRRFYDSLDLPVPGQIALLPVYLNDRLVAMFYGEPGEGVDVSGQATDYKRLMQKLALAMNMILLKLKIRAS
ncbi:MAG: hypothetical protein GY716_07620 [bacterium]|nr:hypothetical protein [bacterium]